MEAVMGLDIVREMANDVGNFFVSLCTPNKNFEDNHQARKLSLGVGTAGVLAALALKFFAQAPTAAAAVLGSFSLSLIAGGITAIPLFSLVPTITLATLVAANIDYSNVVFVYHIN